MLRDVWSGDVSGSWKEKCETERLSQSSLGREHRTKPAILMQLTVSKYKHMQLSFFFFFSYAPKLFCLQLFFFMYT